MYADPEWLLRVFSPVANYEEKECFHRHNDDCTFEQLSEAYRSRRAE